MLLRIMCEYTREYTRDRSKCDAVSMASQSPIFGDNLASYLSVDTHTYTHIPYVFLYMSVKLSYSLKAKHDMTW
jgi:hypothetical protein